MTTGLLTPISEGPISEGPISAAPSVEIVPPRVAIGYLVEIDTLARPLDWRHAGTIFCSSTTVLCSDTEILAGAGAIFVAPVDAQVIDAVYEDGAPLGAADSPADLFDVATPVEAAGATPGSWYFDAANRLLYVRTSDDTLAHVIQAAAVECLAFGIAPAVILRGGLPIVYDARLRGLPSVDVGLDTADLGAAATLAYGALDVLNQDGHWDRLLAERSLRGAAVRVYRGDLSLADRDRLSLWAVGLVDAPSLTPEACRLPLVSAARTLDGPVCPSVFDVATYPDLADNAVGQPIPRCWGRLTDAAVIAWRIASGRWKCSAVAVGSLAVCTRSDGSAVTLTDTFPALGEFTVSAAEDTEATLYVDVTAVGLDTPGAVLAQLLADSGIPTASLDLAAFAALDADRPYAIGMQAVGGSVREALSALASSVLADWYVGRDGLIAARARRADQGNLVANPGFEADVDGWVAHGSCTLARTTVHAARGVASGLITLSVASGPAYAAISITPPEGVRLIVTCFAAPTAAIVPTMFRLAIASQAGALVLTDPVPLVAGEWTRIRAVLQVAGFAAVLCSDTTILCSDTTILIGAAPAELRVYPSYASSDGAAASVPVVVDDVQVCAGVLVDDVNARVTGVELAPLVLEQVAVRYEQNVRDGTALYASLATPTIRRLYPLAESRRIEGQIRAAADAAAVAQAVLDVYGIGRARLSLDLLDWTAALDVGDVLDVQELLRVPPIANGPGLASVTRVSEALAGGSQGSVIHVEAEMPFDPGAGALVLV